MRTPRWIAITCALAALSIAAGSYGQAAKHSNTEKIDSITVEFEPGMVNNPVWRAITIKSDGTATSWLGSIPKTATYRANGLKQEFDKLARMIAAVKYSSLERYYGPAAFDIPITTVSVLCGKTRKTVVDWGKPEQPPYEKEAPEGLKKIEDKMLDLCTSVHWDKVSDKAKFPRYMPSIDCH